MTLQECKDKVAIGYGYKIWQEFFDMRISCHDVIKAMEEAAELYRQSAIDDLHNKIMTQWSKDYGSIDREQGMDAYTVSGFIQEALKETK